MSSQAKREPRILGAVCPGWKPDLSTGYQPKAPADAGYDRAPQLAATEGADGGGSHVIELQDILDEVERSIRPQCRRHRMLLRRLTVHTPRCNGVRCGCLSETYCAACVVERAKG